MTQGDMEDPKLSLTATSLPSPGKSLNLNEENSDNPIVLRHKMHSMIGSALQKFKEQSAL